MYTGNVEIQPAVKLGHGNLNYKTKNSCSYNLRSKKTQHVETSMATLQVTENSSGIQQKKRSWYVYTQYEVWISWRRGSHWTLRETLTKQKTNELIPQIIEKIKDYDCIVYYRGGAGREYFNLMREACRRAGKTLVSFGYRFMGDINELPNVLSIAKQGQLDRISNIKSVQVE